MTQYFKKADGTIIQVNSNHDIDSLKARFTECDADGNEVKKEKPKEKPKAKKSKKEDK